MPAEHENRTKHIAMAFSERRDIARVMLRHQMDARGLTEAAGWKINETVRHVVGGTELVLRPIHMREEPPPDLEVVIGVSEEDGSTDLRM